MDLEENGENENTEGLDNPFESSGSDEPTIQENEPSDDGGDGSDDSNEWKPNLTYRKDKERIAFDEWLHPVVTSPEIETQVRELYTRANGFDDYKSRLEERQSKIDNLTLETQRLKEESEYARQGIEGLKKLAIEDFPSFAHMVGLDDEKVLGYATRRLDYQEKTPAERKLIDDEIAQRVSSYSRSAEAETLRRQNSALMQKQHESEMLQALSIPEITKFQTEFDKRLGKDGAFRDHVRQYGSSQYQASKRYVKPLEAVQAVYQQYKPMFANALEEAINENATKNNQNAGSKPPRNLGSGRNTTMVTKRIMSIADLRKRANELAAEG